MRVSRAGNDCDVRAGRVVNVGVEDAERRFWTGISDV